MSSRVRVIDNRKEFDRIAKNLKKFKRGKTSIGIFTKGGGPETDLAARAVVNEFGSKRKRKKKKGVKGKSGPIITPARPYNRRTFDKNQGKIQKKMDTEHNHS